MPTVLSVGSRPRAPVLITLRYEDGGEPRCYAITEKEYLALGAPAVGTDLSEEEAERLAALDERHRARAAAARILAAGDNSAHALTQKLRTRCFSAPVAEATAREMAERGYLREGDQLERAVILAVNKKLWGRGRVIAALTAKGYAREEITATLDRLAESGEIDLKEARRRLLEKYAAADLPKRRAALYRYGHIDE